MALFGSMNRPLRAALLSGIVCPGAGQLYNRQRLKGLVFILGTLAALAVLIVKVAQETWRAVLANADAIGDSPMSVFDLAHQIEQRNGQLCSILTVAIVALWVLSIWDAWRSAARPR